MIAEQIPARVSVASVDRSRRVETAIGGYDIHHLAPALFGGFTEWSGGGSIATPEEELFDLVYLRATAGGRAYVPELFLPDGSDEGVLSRWRYRIGGTRLRTIVRGRLGELLADAGSRAADTPL